MEPIYQQEFHITDHAVDRYGRLKPSMLLYYVQEVAGRHIDAISLDYDALARRGMIWAIIRQRVQVSRMPRLGETIRLETWPMPTTRSAYPRSVVAYDQSGNEVFRSISIWVLMDSQTRAMVLPGKSGIDVPGTLRGTELAVPKSLLPMCMQNHHRRTVRYTDLDRNGHMNNTRYFDWIDDLTPSDFHRDHPVKEFTICYHAEAREGQELDMNWEIQDGPGIQVDATRQDESGNENRVFSAKILYG